MSLCCVVQALADKKKDVMDEDILALVSDEVHQPEKLWDVLDLQVALLFFTMPKIMGTLGLTLSLNTSKCPVAPL